MPRGKPKRNKRNVSQQQPYDTILKSLVEGQEHFLLSEFVPGIEYLETLDIEVLRLPLRADRVYRVKYREQPHILHLEFESGPDEDMAFRLANYHTYFLYKYRQPVLSVIVYPFRNKMAILPFHEMSGDQELLRFRFSTFALWQQEAVVYVREQKLRLYALLPAMQGANASLPNN